MKRVAFTMKLKPDCAAEYQKRHDEIWPSLTALLRQSGISDYSIFLDAETLTLFATLKFATDDPTASLSAHPVMQRWWAFMADLMETNPDHSPVCVGLKEVFYLE